MQILNNSIDLKQLASAKKDEYQNAEPFPNIAIENFFNEDILNKVLDEFPDLSKKSNVNNFNNVNEKKLQTRGEVLFGDVTKLVVHYMNSEPILEFLQELTGITETLLPDPYFVGGGYHEIKPGGLLRLHADFNKHEKTKLDRRINLLVYLNKDWEESYGGHFELWDKDMTKAYKKLLPIFNRVAIFSTTDFSYHGHPDPLTCPEGRSRKSLAFYYYSNGRPEEEISKEDHTTLFVKRKGVDVDPWERKSAITAKDILREITPPVIFNVIKRMLKN